MRCGMTGDALWTEGEHCRPIARSAGGGVRNYAMSRAYLCVSVAVRGDRTQDGQTLRSVTDGIGARIHPFFERFGGRPTYLLSAGVLADPGCVALFERLGPSVELGTHVGDDAPRDDERAAITEVTDRFIRAFGHQPQSFRGAGTGPGRDTLGIVESLGYAVDASVTPHVGSGDGAPTQPYRPDVTTPTRDGDATLLEVPVTIRRRPMQAVPGIGRRVQPRWLSPARQDARALVRVAEDELTAARRGAPDRPVILHAVLDDVDVLPGAGARHSKEEGARGVLDGLRALLVFGRGAGIPVIGLADVPEILR